tara:strand:- start:8186 stop:8323 length:138 start_codon:yes stop_codon:yes gene_type:complete
LRQVARSIIRDCTGNDSRPIFQGVFQLSGLTIHLFALFLFRSGRS